MNEIQKIIIHWTLFSRYLKWQGIKIDRIFTQKNLREYNCSFESDGRALEKHQAMFRLIDALN
jgi:hypothetical protein